MNKILVFLFGASLLIGKEIVPYVSFVLWLPSEDGLAISYDLDPSNYKGTSSSVYYPEVDFATGFKFGLVGNFFYPILLNIDYLWFGDVYKDFVPLNVPTVQDAQQIDSKYRINSYGIPVAQSFTGTPLFDATYGSLSNGPYAVNGLWNKNFQRISFRAIANIVEIENFEIDSFFGLIVAYDNSELFLSWTALVPNVAESEPLQNTAIRLRMVRSSKSNWLGVGPYFGGNLNCKLTGNEEKGFLGFFLDWGVALASGWVDASTVSSESLYNEDTPPEVSVNNAVCKDLLGTLSPALESNVGICWRGKVENIPIELKVGWEEQVWFNHNRIFAFGQDGDLFSGQPNFSFDPTYGKGRKTYSFAKGKFVLHGLTFSISGAF